MAARWVRAAFFLAAAFGSGAALASAFDGDFHPSVFYDDDIFDGPSLVNIIGDVSVTDGPGASDLNLSLSFAGVSASLPLVVAGNVATLATPGLTLGTTTVLDVYLLSDGNNMAMAYVTQEGGSAISYAASVWQRTPVSPGASAALGTWLSSDAFGNDNLRDLGGGFVAKMDGFNIVENAGSFALTAAGGGHSINVPLVVGGGTASLLSSPSVVGGGNWQTFNMVYDGAGGGALFFVGTELGDPSDVSVNLALVSLAPVPEPENYAMMLVGCALLAGVMVHRRRG